MLNFIHLKWNSKLARFPKTTTKLSSKVVEMNSTMEQICKGSWAIGNAIFFSLQWNFTGPPYNVLINTIRSSDKLDYHVNFMRLKRGRPLSSFWLNNFRAFHAIYWTSMNITLFNVWNVLLLIFTLLNDGKKGQGFSNWNGKVSNEIILKAQLN